VASKNERQIAIRELLQPFATVRIGSPPFAVVRHRSLMIKNFKKGFS
jgi:hypothetical protein